jgi:RNA polymerase sigma-70 factor (ECF subfamily)
MPQEPAHKVFKTTRWTIVRQAIDGEGVDAHQALANLCEIYWYPLYAYVRRSGLKPEEAEDATQNFFFRLLDKQILHAADPAKGRLRSFLLACLRNHLADERDRAMAKKRGASLVVSFDPAVAERIYLADAIEQLTPDQLYQRRWALSLLEASMEVLADEYRDAGQQNIYAALRPFLGFSAGPERRYDEVAADLAMPVGTIKSHVHRMRKRWRDILFERVGDTLNNPTPEDIKDELRELMGCL